MPLAFAYRETPENAAFRGLLVESNAAPNYPNSLEAQVYTELLAGQKVDMVFSDPPYNVPISGHVMGNGQHQHPEFAMASGEMSADQLTQFLSVALGHMRQALAPGSLLYICMDWRHLVELSTAARYRLS